MKGAVEQLSHWVSLADSIAVITGAGISTASGIPDFRSAGGLYSNAANANVFDLNTFIRNPSLFYTFARTFYPQVSKARPNAAHRILAEWSQHGREVSVITQNIDDYHQRAGSAPVYTVHGNFIHSSCLRCGNRVETETLRQVIEDAEIPHCGCGGVYKPEITFFGEMLPEYDWKEAVSAISRAALVLVLGTSLSVYPAAGLPGYRNPGSRLAIINREPVPLDEEADCVIHDDLCEVMQAVSKNIG